MRITVGHILLFVFGGFLIVHYWGHSMHFASIGSYANAVVGEAKKMAAMSRQMKEKKIDEGPGSLDVQNDIKQPAVSANAQLSTATSAQNSSPVDISTGASAVSSTAVSAAPQPTIVPSPTPFPSPTAKTKHRREKNRKTPKTEGVRLAIEPPLSGTTKIEPDSSPVVREKTANPSPVLSDEDPYSKMIGTYVIFELSSGRRIQGVYDGKKGDQYQIQLPGMGPFSYPANTVKSVTVVR